MWHSRSSCLLAWSPLTGQLTYPVALVLLATQLDSRTRSSKGTILHIHTYVQGIHIFNNLICSFNPIVSAPLENLYRYNNMNFKYTFLIQIFIFLVCMTILIFHIFYLFFENFLQYVLVTFPLLISSLVSILFLHMHNFVSSLKIKKNQNKIQIQLVLPIYSWIYDLSIEYG